MYFLYRCIIYYFQDIDLTEDEAKTTTEEEKDSNTESLNEQSSSSQKRVPNTPTIKPPPPKRFQAKQKPSAVHSALEEFNEIVSKVNKQDAFDSFGQYVAAELRELPNRKAIILQQQMQNLITNAKLSCLQPSPSTSSMSLSRSSLTNDESVIYCTTPQLSPDPESIFFTTENTERNTTPNTDYNSVLPNTVWSNKNTPDVLEKAMDTFSNNTVNAMYMKL